MSESAAPRVRRPAPGTLGQDVPIVTFALCLDCGAEVDDWRERLLPIQAGTLAVTERGELALHIEREGVCDECGGGRAEIRVEARRLPCA